MGYLDVGIQALGIIANGILTVGILSFINFLIGWMNVSYPSDWFVFVVYQHGIPELKTYFSINGKQTSTQIIYIYMVRRQFTDRLFSKGWK